MPEEQNVEPQPVRIYVSAFVCHEILYEPEHNLLTAVRISDGYAAYPIEINLSRPDLGPGAVLTNRVYQPLDTHVVIIFRTDSNTEIRTVTSVKGIQPDGQRSPAGLENFPIVVGGENKSHTIKLNARIPTHMAGTYWFEIYLADDLEMKVPIQILHPDPALESVQITKIQLSEPPRLE